MTTSTNPMATKSRSNADDPLEIDPVCGMEIPRGAAPTDTYFEGQRFYFCGDACKRRFEEEPARYCVSCIEVK